MKETVQIVILSRDRAKYLKESLDSVLNQNLSKVTIKVIVSDNSEQEEVREMIERDYPSHNFEYIRRNPPVPAREHFQLIISECEERYIVMFHDDDIMHPDYVETMFPFIQKEGVSAVGCNAFLCKNSISKSKDKAYYFETYKEFDNEKDFLEQYSPGNGGITPFPSYMYCTNFLKKISLVSLPGAKYFDVILLSTMLKYGLIVWLPDTLMYYRIHDENDSNIEDTVGGIALLNYIAKKRIGKNQDFFVAMRYDLWIKWLPKQDKVNLFSWRNRVVFKFLLLRSFYFAGKLFFWRAVFRRIKIFLRGN